MTVAIVDLDILVYRAGFASQHKLDDGTIDVEPIEYALHTAKRMLINILKETGATKYKGYLTSGDKSNFRYNVATIKGYKANRGVKPVHYADIRTYFIENWKACVIANMEADDAMGIMQTKLAATGLDSVICSIDKDMRMIPGRHYDIVNGTRYKVSYLGRLLLDREGVRPKLIGGGLKWFYSQMLLGDSADNIPGIARMGPVKVFNVLHKTETEFDMLYKIIPFYKQQYADTWRSAMIEVGHLLWIRQCDRKEWLTKELEELLQ